MKNLLTKISRTKLVVALKRLLYGKKADKGTTIIEIENLTEPQKIALEDMLKEWMVLGGIGSSRWTCFFADGDGNFRPKIKIDGREPKYTTIVDRKNFWHGDEYRIDFDTIAWALHD